MSGAQSNDRSFTGMRDKFARNIYATNKGRLRLAVLQRDLQQLISQSDKLRVLDIGAGLGQLSQAFAAAGHHVTHTDISAEMVAAAMQAHEHAGLQQHYRYLVASLHQLPEQLGSEQFDLVLCHAVLEWLTDPAAALAVCKQFMHEQGQLSLMFYNRDAKLLANVIYGNFDYVNDDLQVKKKVKLSPQQPLQPIQVSQWLQQLNLQIMQQTGVRCFHDYLRNRSDQQRYQELLALELRFNQQPPFNQIGRYLHWLVGHA